jgi:hypothetical protein
VLQLISYGGVADNTKTNAGTALILLTASNHNGANALADVLADGNVFGVQARRGSAYPMVFMVDEDGDLFADGGSLSTTMVTLYDEYEDPSLARAFDYARGGKGMVRTKWDEFVTYNEKTLIELGILGGTREEGGLWNITRHLQMLNGSVWQLWTDIMEIASVLPPLERSKLPERIRAKLEGLNA